MALEKEALTNTIESDLARRNRNWDKIDTHIEQINNKLQYFQPPTRSIPYDSGDNAWKDTNGVHFYYIGGDGTARGYPTNFAILVHMKVPTGGTIFQQCWGNSGNLWYRKVLSDQSAADAQWVKIG